MPFFTRVFRSKDSNATKKNVKPPVVQDPGPPKPSWSDAWLRSEIAPDEVQDLLRGCTQELKARGMLVLQLPPVLESPKRAHSSVADHHVALQLLIPLSSLYLSAQAPTPARRVPLFATTSTTPLRKVLQSLGMS